jgi:hypothetical protein
MDFHRAVYSDHSVRDTNTGTWPDERALALVPDDLPNPTSIDRSSVNHGCREQDRLHSDLRAVGIEILNGFIA